MREETAALDQYIAPGLRLWMLIGLVSGVLLVMIVIVCCFIKIRIPRTKRQIELIAAERKIRKAKAAQNGGGFAGTATVEPHEGGSNSRSQPIVMNSLPKIRSGITYKKGDALASRSIPV